MNAMKGLCTYSFIAKISNKLPTTGISQLDAGSSVAFCKQFTCMPIASLTLREMKGIFLKNFIPLNEILGKSVL